MRWKILAVAAAFAVNAVPAHAGIYTDDLSRCLVESSSHADKAVLVRWIVVAMTQHPAVAGLGSATAADIDKVSAETGALFMRLLTDACLDKSKKAIRYEGPAAIQSSFSVLGQVAASELFADPTVQQVMSGLQKYVDAKKLEALKSEE